MLKANTAARVMLAACVAVALAVGLSALSGCAGETVNDSPMSTSARDVPCEPAFGEGYETAYAAVTEKASDAQLVAVRSASYSAPGIATEWMYLFYSWDRSRAYTVVMEGGQATVGEYGNMAFTQDELAEIPAHDEVAVDADAAYEAAIATLEGEDTVYSWRAYLMLYDESEKDSAGDVMKWVFQFNSESDIEEQEKAAARALNDAAEPFVILVDAHTGEVGVDADTVDAGVSDAESA